MCGCCAWRGGSCVRGRRRELDVAGNGTTGFNGDNIPATSAELNNPTGVAVDAGGDLLIADTSNQRVRLVAAAGCASGCPYGLASMTKGDIYTVAGTGTFGFNGDNIPATSAQLNNPVGVGVDAGGDLLIADTSNQRVRSVIGGALAQLQALLAVVGALPSSTARTVLNVQVADAIAAEQAGKNGACVHGSERGRADRPPRAVLWPAHIGSGHERDQRGEPDRRSHRLQHGRPGTSSPASRQALNPQTSPRRLNQTAR